jgi:uncharacterized membrane protein
MPLRIAVIVLAYLLYRLPGDERIAAGAFIGIGTLILGLSVVDRLTRWSRDRSRLMEVGSILLGLGLLGVGILLAVR